MKSSLSIWRYVVNVIVMVKISSIFVAFLENMNFRTAKRIFCSCCGEFLIYTRAFSWIYMTLPLPFTTLLYNNTNDFWCNIVNNYVEICIFILTTTFAKKMRYFFYYIQPTIIDLGAVRIGWYCMYFVTFAHILLTYLTN